MQKYQVLNCITDLNIGGAELMLARFARSLHCTNFTPRVLSLMPPGPAAALFAEDKVPIDTLDMKKARPSVRAALHLLPAVRRGNADVLHGWMYHGNVAASLGAFLDRRQPVIWSVHHSVDDIRAEKRLTRLMIQLSARLSSRTFAISYCSRASADQHEKLGFDSSKRVVIPNGIDCEEFRPRTDAHARLRAMFGIPSSRLIIGNVARAHPMKNHEGFVRTLALLRKDGCDVHGLIIGDGHEEGVARQTARDLGVSDYLTTPGLRSDIAELLPGMDIFFLSSAWGEAFPLSVGEAMACGVPAVVTDVGDCDWLVGDRKMVAKPDDLEEQAALLRSIAELAGPYRRELGIAARNRVLENFSLQKYTESHIRLYDAAIGERTRPGGAG